MKLSEWLMAKALIKVIESGSITTKAEDIAAHFDAMLDAKFKGESEALQLVTVSHILIPLCREILKEDPISFKKIIDQESSALSREISKTNLYV